MTTTDILILAIGGLVSGIMAGLLGIGGGVILVPLLVALGNEPIKATATSSLAIVITSVSGSLQNWRMGYFNLKKILYLGIPALITAQLGVVLAINISSYLLLFLFGFLLLINIYLVQLRKQLLAKGDTDKNAFNPTISRIATGGAGGLLAGLFGVGGGVIMVPLQMLLLGEHIKVAIQTSLGVIISTAVSSSITQAYAGNVLFIPGIILGCGGLLGAQISTRVLPKLPDNVVSIVFRSFLGILSIYIFYRAWLSYQGLAR
ncbi:MAG: sulfite exporter TauE/SafE family protein [Chroococcus sp. CMT-3BRIN-NPC107]|nr:sulfite exporter TauE/SafE family protein [Chroococcus sp. CMT-3BRIN-NPC107]